MKIKIIDMLIGQLLPPARGKAEMGVFKIFTPTLTLPLAGGGD